MHTKPTPAETRAELDAAYARFYANGGTVTTVAPSARNYTESELRDLATGRLDKRLVGEHKRNRFADRHGNAVSA